MTSPKLKDYLTIAAIGYTIVVIALSSSALQQTYGIAGHSLVLLSSYLFSMGLYLLAIALSQDSSLRISIKKSVVNLIGDIGTANREKSYKAYLRSTERIRRTDWWLFRRSYGEGSKRLRRVSNE
jgi:hypothetical protein